MGNKKSADNFSTALNTISQLHFERLEKEQA
jgi:hypothetical protein